MGILKAGYEVLSKIDGMQLLKSIEVAGRTCYISESSEDTDEATKTFVRGLIKSGHLAMIEHEKITVKLTCDRGVSHELVRHRIASFAQESTRYCNYGKNRLGNTVNVIDIRDIMLLEVGKTVKDYTTGLEVVITADVVKNWISCWLNAIVTSENMYMQMVTNNCPAQLARSVLTTSTKTAIVITMNLREWRHFFQLRALGTTGKPHPQMIEITVPMLAEFKELVPVIFDDLEV